MVLHAEWAHPSIVIKRGKANPELLQDLVKELDAKLAAYRFSKVSSQNSEDSRRTLVDYSGPRANLNKVLDTLKQTLHSAKKDKTILDYVIGSRKRAKSAFQTGGAKISDGIIIKVIPGKSLVELLKELKKAAAEHRWKYKLSQKSEDSSKILIGFDGPQHLLVDTGKSLKKVLAKFKEEKVIEAYKVGFGNRIPESWMKGFRRRKRRSRSQKGSGKRRRSKSKKPEFIIQHLVIYRKEVGEDPEAMADLARRLSKSAEELNYKDNGAEKNPELHAVKFWYRGPTKKFNILRNRFKKILSEAKKKKLIKDYRISKPLKWMLWRFQKGGAAETINVMLVPVLDILRNR